MWGSLINNCRNLAIKLNVIIPQNDIATRAELHALISNYPFAVKEHLRSNVIMEEIIFTDEFKEEDYLKASHKPNHISKRLTVYILNVCKKSNFMPNDYLILNQNLNELTDICGACERIKNTPIPYSYSIFIKKIIFLYIITMPITFGLTIGYWSVPIVMIMFYAFASLELISEEIEDPFGLDPNDLPTDDMSLRIRENVVEILKPDAA